MRVTVAVVLLAVATAAVVLAIPTGSYALVSVASVLALACGWASARIVYTELSQSRRDNARDRASQAEAYRKLFTARAEEHAEFTAVMTDKLAKSDRDFREVSTELVTAQRRVDAAEALAKSLEDELASRKAEEDERLGVWDPSQLIPTNELEGVADLMAWEAKVHADAATVEERKQA